MQQSKQTRLELIKLSEKILFESYISDQLKLDLMLKAYPYALQLYLEHCPKPPTEEDIIATAKSFENYINGDSNDSNDKN